MRVLDVIQESRGDIINDFLRGVAWAFGRGTKAKAAEELAEAWLERMLRTGDVNASMPVNAIRNPEALRQGLDDASTAAGREVIEAARRAAVKEYRKAERLGLLRDIASGARVAAHKVGVLMSWSKAILQFALYTGSLWHTAGLGVEYARIKKELDDELNSGKLTEEEYRDEIGAQRLRLVGEMGASLGILLGGFLAVGAATLASKGGSLIIRILTFNKWKNALAPVAGLFNTAVAGVQYAFIYQIAVNKGIREKLMDLILSDNVVSNNLVWAAGDPETHPFVTWAKEFFSSAKDTVTGNDPGPQAVDSSGNPVGQQRPQSQPRQRSPEKISTKDIDWSKEQ